MYSELSCRQRDGEELRCAKKMSSENEKLIHEAYKRYYRYMVSAVNRRVRNLYDAEDICQEIFIALSKKIHEVEHVKGWLLNSMMFYIPNYYREAGRLNCYPRQVSENIHDLDIIVERDDFEVQMIVDDMVNFSYNYENEQQLLVFELVALCQFSYVETSRLMGKSIRQVGYQYCKVMMRMIAYLRERGIAGLRDVC